MKDGIAMAQDKDITELDFKFRLIQWYHKPELFYEDLMGHPPYKYQKDFIYQFKNPEENKRILCVAAGGTGKTEMIAAASLFIAIVLSNPIIYNQFPGLRKEPHETLILSGSLLQAKKVYGYSRNALTNSKWGKFVVLSRAITQTFTEFLDGAIVKALPNSLTATQGQHCYVVIVDEAALVHDFQLDDCYRIVGAHDGIIVWSGTPTTYESKFVSTFEVEEERQLKGEKGDWKLFTWSAKDCPALQKAYEEAKATLPEDMVQIFWEGRPFPLTGTLIPRDSMLNATRGITKFSRKEDWYVTFGIDWGWGDPTTLVISQTDGRRYEVLEAYKWTATDFEYIHNFVAQKALEYHPVRIFTDNADKGNNLALMKKQLPVFTVVFNQEKAMMQSRLRDVFVKEEILIPDINENAMQDLIYELRTYTWEKKSGEDLVEGLMMSVKEWLPKESDGKIHIASGKFRHTTRKRPFYR